MTMLLGARVPGRRRIAAAALLCASSLGSSACAERSQRPIPLSTVSVLRPADNRPLRWCPSRRDTLAVWVDSATWVSGWEPEFMRLVADAGEAWRAAGVPVHFARAGSPDSADVRVHWVRWKDGTERGATTWALDASGELIGAEVTIVLAPRRTLPVSSATLLYPIVLHEVGHALGLPHARSSDSVMYFRTGGALTLGDSDRKAVRAAYSGASN